MAATVFNMLRVERARRSSRVTSESTSPASSRQLPCEAGPGRSWLRSPSRGTPCPRLQGGNLCRHALLVRRDPCIAVNHTTPLCSGFPQRKSHVFSMPWFCCEILEFCTSDLQLRRHMFTKILHVRLPLMIAHVISFVLQNLPALLPVVVLLVATVRCHRGPVAERFLSWIMLLPIGITGLWAGAFHVFFPATAAKLIGWDVSPFQLERGGRPNSDRSISGNSACES